MGYLEKHGMTDMQLKAKVLVMFEDGITQTHIANIFNVSQSTVSSWIKEAKYLNEIGIIRNEVEQYKRSL
ncbi:helix-turn-helix domain-containing protein [Pectobacterium parvum]|uniref:helix-turn-helix domain-containing protein n=1 Tax=Pectobacterium parvum TaxID=2778550 RepID=UPI0037FCDA5B